MMTALPPSNKQTHVKKLHMYVFLSYFIGLGANLPMFFAYKIAANDEGYDANVPWLKVSHIYNTPI